MTAILPEEQLYETDLFLDPIAEEFKCAICLCIVKDAQTVADCGHLFCRICITNHIQSSPNSNFCPIDRQLATGIQSANRSVLNIINNLRVRCRNDGCGARMALSEFDRHEAMCSHCGRAPPMPVPPTVAGEQVSINVTLVNLTKKIIITASLNETVLALKQKIQLREGLRADRMRLTFVTKDLDDDMKRLRDYNIKNGSIVFTNDKFNGGIISFN